jgi:hypothetical protein
LPRQRINAFFSGGRERPDAERTLQFPAWLMAAKKGDDPFEAYHSGKSDMSRNT